jgi:hypothetical protein
MAMPADEPRLPVLLEAITNGPILAVKEEIGPESCAHVSTYPGSTDQLDWLSAS